MAKLTLQVFRNRNILQKLNIGPRHSLQLSDNKFRYINLYRSTPIFDMYTIGITRVYISQQKKKITAKKELAYIYFFNSEISQHEVILNHRVLFCLLCISCRGQFYYMYHESDAIINPN